jgi:hypothetical protein
MNMLIETLEEDQRRNSQLLGHLLHHLLHYRSAIRSTNSVEAKDCPQVVSPHFVPPTNVPRFNKDDEAQETSKPVPTPSEIPIESSPQNQTSAEGGTKVDDAIKDAVPDLATVETD